MSLVCRWGLDENYRSTPHNKDGRNEVVALHHQRFFQGPQSDNHHGDSDGELQPSKHEIAVSAIVFFIRVHVLPFQVSIRVYCRFPELILARVVSYIEAYSKVLPAA